MVPFHRPDGRCMSAFMLFRSFMIEMSQAADVLRQEGAWGVQCFSFCLFKQKSFTYVRAAQHSFTLNHREIIKLRKWIKLLTFPGVGLSVTEEA